MTEVKITGLSRIGANAVAMFFESGAFTKAFLESKECEFAQGSGDSADWDIGTPTVSFDVPTLGMRETHKIAFED
jgi:hypothetical protein